MSREMKNSGVGWIGEIPEDWTIRKIKFSLNEHIEKNDPIKSKNILSLTAKQGVIPLSKREGGGNKPKEDFSAYKLAYPGDIVMNSMNIISGSVGLSNYFGCMSPVYYMLRPVHKEDDVRFYNYVFQSKPFQLSLFGLGNGILVKQTDNDKFNTVRLRIPMDKLGDVGIPNISPTEQQQIVHFLDRKCTAIDTAIEKTKKSIEKLEEYKKAVITKAVTKGIDPNAKMKDSGVEWIGEIPKGWDAIRIKYTLQDGIIKSGPYGSALKEIATDSSNGQYPIYNQANVINNNFDLRRNHISDENYERMKNYAIHAGDIVFSMMGTVGKCSIVPDGIEKGIIDSHLFEAKLCEKVNKEYFRYSYDKDFCTLVYEQFIEAMNGSIMNGLNGTLIKNVFICLPSLTEQTRIVHFLDRKCTAINTAIEKKKKAIEKWEEYKKSLIYYAVTGKIDCRNEVIE